MRIVIETNEQEGVKTPIYDSTATPPSQEGAMNGGSPSETLIHSVAEGYSKAAESEGTNAGSPPEWLVEAIKAAKPPGKEDLSTDTDAGAAPASET